MILKFAEVRNIEDDPSKSGRVKVRLYNDQNDDDEIKDDDLPWALPIQPTSSAAFNGVGSTPHGLLPGSRVLVAYMPDDNGQQYPLILGSFSRAFEPKELGVVTEDKETGVPQPDKTNPDGPERAE